MGFYESSYGGGRKKDISENRHMDNIDKGLEKESERLHNVERLFICEKF